MTENRMELTLRQFSVGDKVWWFDSWGNLRWGVIYEIKDEQVRRRRETCRVALIYEEGKKGCHFGAKLSECWPTKEECLEAERRRSIAQKAEYKESIKDVKDLVQFLFEYDVNGEDHDYDAESAAKERAKELLGLEFQD